MSEIKSTKDYGIFRKKEPNREIDRPNLKRLINSIKAQNLLEYRPIIVDKSFYVIDGQHRLEAAKSLNVPIFYQINKEATDEDIILLNTTQKKWELSDYVNFYASKGYENYINFVSLAREKDLSIAELIRVTSTQTWTIKCGKMAYLTNEELQKLNDKMKKTENYLSTMRKYILSDTKFLDGVRFRRAIYMVIKNEDIDWDLFMSKSITKSDALKMCPTAEAYYSLLLDIYNWKNRNKVYQHIQPEPKSHLEDIPDQLSMA